VDAWKSCAGSYHLEIKDVIVAKIGWPSKGYVFLLIYGALISCYVLWRPLFALEVREPAATLFSYQAALVGWTIFGIACLLSILVLFNQKYPLVQRILPVFLSLSTIMLWYLLPVATWGQQINFNLYLDERWEVIEMVNTGKLGGSADGRIALPQGYEHISRDGQIVIKHIPTEEGVVTHVYFMVQGLASSANFGFLYASDNEAPDWQALWSQQYSPNWWWMVFQ